MSSSLADVIREHIDTGTLPDEAPAQIWAGGGSGKHCSACGVIIDSAQTEFELQYNNGREPIRFHFRCHRLWDAERRRRHDQSSNAQ